MKLLTIGPVPKRQGSIRFARGNDFSVGCYGDTVLPTIGIVEIPRDTTIIAVVNANALITTA